MLAGVPPAEWRRVMHGDGIAPSAHRYARAGAKGRDAAHGRGRKARQGRRLVGVPIRHVAPVVTIRHAAAGE